MDSRQNHLPVSFFCQRAYLRLNVLWPAAANPAPGIGNNAIAAELVASVLYLQKCPGVIRDPADL